MDNEALLNRHFKKIVFLAVGFLILILAVYIVLTQQHKGMAKIRIYVAPPDSQISIDGGQSSKKTIYVVPGKHSFIASRQDFTSDSETISAILKGPNNVYLAPTPKGTAGQ